MELVRPADRKRYRPDDRPADEVFLTRRAFLLKGLFLGSFATLAGKLWKMQVIDAREYQEHVAGIIERPEPIRAPRGLIVDRNGAILAENRISWTVAVIPARFPDDPDAGASIRQQLVGLLDLRDLLVVRRAALPAGSEEYVLRELAQLIEQDASQLIGRVLRGGSTAPLYVVRDELPPEEAEYLRDAIQPLPGVHVMDRVEYALAANPGSPLPVVIKKDADREIALQIEANRMYLPGVEVSNETLMRRYPAGPEFSHILGYVGPITKEEYEAAGGPSGPYLLDDLVGRGGLEEKLEAELAGKPGVRWALRDAHGVKVGEMEWRRQEAVPGNTVMLTIDRDFQKAVTEALQEGIDLANEESLRVGKQPVGGGVVVALNPQNGEVLAMVNLPTFDNQLFVDGISQEQYEEYLNNPFKPLTNFAVSGEFPPGSTLKPMMAAAGLQEGVITASSQYRCVGQIRVPVVGDEAGGQYYGCWNLGGHGTVDLVRSLAESCNVFYYNVGAPGQRAEGSDVPLHYYNPGESQPHYFHGLGIDKIHEYMTQEFGFGKPTGIELAGEVSGVVPTPKWLFQSPLREYWSVGDTINVSIGQGHFSCTPLQLTCAIAAIANGGTYYRPRLIRALLDPDGNEIKTYEPEVVHRLNIAPEHIQTIRYGMRLSVTDRRGTAYGKFIKTGDDIPIAGKTGTAEFGPAVDGKGKEQHAWFTAFAPYENPEIVVVVLIEGGGEGATFAVPVADAVLAAYFGKTPSLA